MTANGWFQIGLYLFVIFLLTKPMGVFMTRVFSGEKTFLDPVLRVCVSSNPAAQYLIARAARMARRMDAELHAVYVVVRRDKSLENRKSLSNNMQFAESLGAKVVRLRGRNMAEAVAKFVREKHITQVIFGRSATRGWQRYLYLSAIHRFLRDTPTVDVHIVTQETED